MDSRLLFFTSVGILATFFTCKLYEQISFFDSYIITIVTVYQLLLLSCLGYAKINDWIGYRFGRTMTAFTSILPFVSDVKSD